MKILSDKKLASIIKSKISESLEIKSQEIFYPVQFSSTDIQRIAELFGQTIGKIDPVTPIGQQTAYNNCEIIQSIVDRRADYICSGKIVFKDSKDKEISNSSTTAVLKLLNRPNPLQSWQEFLSAISVYKDVYGFCPVYRVMPVNRSTGIPLALWAIEPPQFWYTLTGKQYNQTKLSEIVSSVSFTNYAGDMIWLRDEQLNDVIILNGKSPRNKMVPFLAQSPLYSMGDIINNFQIGLNVYGTLVQQSIAGIISNKANDVNAGVLPIDPKDEEDVQMKLRTDYGVTKGRNNFIVTNKNLFFQSLLTDVSKLQIPELLSTSIYEACNKIGFQVELLANKDITFENKRSAEIMQYQNAIIPNACYITDYLTSFLNCNGFRIELSFDHLPFLQEDQKTKSENAQRVSTAYEILFLKGGCTLNEWRIQMGQEPLTTFGDLTIFEMSTEQQNIILGSKKPAIA